MRGGTTMRRIPVNKENNKGTSRHGSDLPSQETPVPPVYRGDEAAYPRYIVADDEPTPEAPLSEAFHDRNLSHLIGRKTGEGIWPDDPQDTEALEFFRQGQKALYEDKDMNAAIRSYEAALARDDSFIKAWVALVIAYISDNTSESLRNAQDILENLAAIPVSDWMTSGLQSIIHQNLAYLHVHYYRLGRGREHLAEADRNYGIAESFSQGKDRLEFLCPWAFVKLESGQRDAAQNLWERAERYAAEHTAPHILREYAAKYAPLRTFMHSQ